MKYKRGFTLVELLVAIAILQHSLRWVGRFLII